MRIVAGKHRGRVLSSPNNDDIRPTSDKVRQAVFNILNSRGLLRDAITLDAFCGSGALGLEALSQGSSFCYFFDKDKNSVALTKDNIVLLKEDNRCLIDVQDITNINQISTDLSPATLVFIDPPYNKGLAEQAIPALINKGWVSDDCAFIIETSKAEKLLCPQINIELEKIYGDTKITLAYR